MFGLQKRFLSIFGLICLAGCSSLQMQREVPQAWWLDKSFEPAPVIAGSSFQNADVDWTKVLVFNDEYLKDELNGAQFKSIEESHLESQIKSDLNNDGVDESVMVGVYQSEEEKGRFLAILNENGQLQQVFTQKGITGFSGLLQESRMVRWYTCMACDNYALIRWDNERFVME